MVQGRQSANGEGRFGVGLNEWLHKLNVKKQGGTAHYAVRRSSPRPTLAYIRPWASFDTIEYDAWGIF
jgi:hypothetical protein